MNTIAKTECLVPELPWLDKLPDLARALKSSPKVIWPTSRTQLLDLALGGTGQNRYTVAYDVPGKGSVVEADIVLCKNGVAANYPEPYMRRRDPDTMAIGDDLPTDKPRFDSRFGYPFSDLRREIFDWLGTQELICIPFSAGSGRIDHDALYVGPANAAFFAAALTDLQGMQRVCELRDGFAPKAILYLAPPFRHTHCSGKQVVVHNRLDICHEVFALNLYPGPSAKKGIYGVLLDLGESEGWVTAHASAVRVVTPYDCPLTIMHEGASGGGKSEMLEYPTREEDGRIQLGTNVVSGEQRRVPLGQNCSLEPVTDDMALCHPSHQGEQKKLVVTDAENAWFVRVDGIGRYGANPEIERMCMHPVQPLVFLNVEGVPGATCLPWDHIEDSPGKRCSNPRVILPRSTIPHIVDEPVEVDVRSFGVRCPPCTKDSPSYGIIGLMHLLPPAVAWLWRLVAPRGHGNPSIIASGGDGLISEGVGSFWPFATGRKVEYANLLLDQIRDCPATRHVLIPNQHIGSWKVGFNGQWIAREYLARRGGAKFRPDQIVPARFSLLGYALNSMLVEGYQIPTWFLRTENQQEMGHEAYDKGAGMLAAFFKAELAPYLDEPDLDPLGAEIIKACLADAGVDTYDNLLRGVH